MVILPFEFMTYKNGNSPKTIAESDGDHHNVPPRATKILLYFQFHTTHEIK